MSAFHRVDGPRDTMPGPLYFTRAVRLGAYAGVLQARAAQERADRDGELDRAPVGASRGSRAAEVSDTVMLTKLANEGWADYERGAP